MSGVGYIKEINYQKAAVYKSQAARDHVSISDTKQTHWFGMCEDNELIGVAGLLLLGKNRARIKGVWIRPDYRGLGYGDSLTRHLIRHADSLMCSQIEAFAHAPEWYLGQGWKVFGKLPNGATKVRKNL